MGPVAATPVKPEPEMAPIIAHTTTLTIPKPPLIRPIKASHRSSSRFATPLPPMKVPARMNSGLASSTVPMDWEYAQSIMLFMDTLPKTAMNISAPPKQ
jgi:hypothetical protein